MMWIHSAGWLLLACVHTQRRADVQVNKKVEKQACCSVEVVAGETQYTKQKIIKLGLYALFAFFLHVDFLSHQWK